MTRESPPRPAATGSWFGRVLSAPLGDLVRGRIPPARSADDIFAQAVVPADVSAAALELLAALRLPVLSRAEAASALAAHLRQQLAAHVPAEPLIAELRSSLADSQALRRAVGVAGGDVLTIPAALRELVLRVVGRARLWRREQLDVAAELCAHFRDGLDAGASVPDLLGGFGDAKAAARLIRRAKVRGRPLAWQVWRIARNIVGGALAASVVFYAGLAIWAYSQKPTLSRNFLAEINAPIRAIPPEQRAWPLYREAYLATCPWPEFRELAEPHLREFAQENEPALTLYREGAARPRLGAIASSEPDEAIARRNARTRSFVEPGAGEAADNDEQRNPMLVEVVLPQLTVVREGARLVWIDAYWAARAGDGRRFVADVRAMLRMAEQVREPSTLIAEIVRLAMIAQTMELVGFVLRDAGEQLTEAELAELAHILGGVEGGGPLQIDMRGERLFIADAIQRMYSDDGRGGGRLTPQGLAMMTPLAHARDDKPIPLPSPSSVLAPAACLLAVGRAELWREYEGLMDGYASEAAEPLWLRRSSQAEQRFESLTGPRGQTLRYLVLRLLMPSLVRASLIPEFATQRRDATLAALAGFAYEKRHGCWPASLEVLVPQYLPSVPLDRFDGRPLRYRVVDDRPLIYSVGADFVDNDGTRPRSGGGELHTRLWRPLDRRGEPPQSPDWKKVEGTDWVLWPPE